ncbi:hypothetical protein DSUL_20410 [Desulfovibrionales bacterium]
MTKLVELYAMGLVCKSEEKQTIKISILPKSIHRLYEVAISIVL